MSNQPPEAQVSFSRDIKPLFRDKDQASMKSAFDLFSLDDVRAHATAISERLKTGTMPCDGSWPPEQVALFERWVAEGSAP